VLTRRLRPGVSGEIAWTPDGTAGPWARVLDGAGAFVPAQDAVVGNVAEDEPAPGGEVEGALGPAAVVVEELEAGVAVGAAAGPEAVVQNLVDSLSGGLISP
jgi:hypothetical protein